MLSTSGTSPEVGVTECSRHDAKEKKACANSQGFYNVFIDLSNQEINTFKFYF